MILNNKLTIRYCLILLFLLIIAILSKQIIYENYDVSNNSRLQSYLDGYKGAVDVTHYDHDYLTDGGKVESHETDGYICMARYNILLEAYKDSLNNVNSLLKNPNMPNSLFPLEAHIQNVEGVTTADAQLSAKCPKTYSVSDSNFYRNVAFDEHYINWLNINILRHFGNRSCNITCSKFLQKNLHDDSFELSNDISPSLVSLVHYGYYDSSSLNLPEKCDENNPCEDFEVFYLTNGLTLEAFYKKKVEELYKENVAPRRKYFGVGKVGDIDTVWLVKADGVKGLNKLIQGCAILDGGSDAPEAKILTNSNVADLKYTPADMITELKSINYIDPIYISRILTFKPTSENVISVFGFFV